MFNDFDFIGFTYNGKHSYNDFGMYRVIDGDRYSEDLVPQMNDKIADVPGGDGQYFFGTNYKSRTFSVNIAFDGLTEEQFREMRHWLDGKDIHDLIFDERPYKIYSAKVSGTPQLKYIAFSENEKRVYKGEGTIQFTCYYPFAHTHSVRNDIVEPEPLINIYGDLTCGLVVWKGETIKNLHDFSIKLNYTELDFDNTNTYNLTPGESFTFTQAVFIDSISVEIGADTIISNLQLSIDGIKTYSSAELLTFVYTKNHCFEVNSVWKQYIDGRNINYYSIADYPTKKEWVKSFNPMLEKMIINYNYGDVPAVFTVTYSDPKNTVNKDTTFKVGNYEITTKEACTNFKWDSRSGLVTGTPTGDSKDRPIQYIGKSCGKIPVGEIKTLELNGAQLKFSYWYY